MAHVTMAHGTSNGLKILRTNQPENDNCVTFILIPGVGSLSTSNWVFNASSWLSEAVPAGYMTKVLAFENSLHTSNSLQGRIFVDEGSRLLLCLDQYLSTADDVLQGPIIMICHCLGGQILKQTLHLASFNRYQYGDILSSIAGTIFLGTPHCQNDPQVLSDTLHAIFACCSREGPSKSSPTSQKDEVGSLCDAAREFRDSTGTIEILSCYEALPTKSRSSRTFRKAKEVLIVSKNIATIDVRDEILLELPCNHIDLPAFSQHEAPSFKRITGWVSAVIQSFKENSLHQLKTNEMSLQGSRSESNVSSALSQARRGWAGRFASSQNHVVPQLSPSIETADLDPISRLDSVVVERKRATIPCFMLQNLTKNPDFQGRKDVLSRIDRALLPQFLSLDQINEPVGARCVVLHGPPGIGKTETAVEYAYSRRNKFDAVFWIRADDVELVESDFAQLTVHLGLESAQDQRNPIISREIAKEWLSNPIKDPSGSIEATWLIIFDNADEPDLLADYVQTLGNGLILITTRDPDTKDICPAWTEDIMIEPMSQQEGAALLEHFTLNARRKPDQYRSLEISEQLNGFPLAITQMAFYIRNKRLNYSEFLDVYKDSTAHEQLHRQVAAQQRKTARGSVSSIWAFDELSPSSKHLLEVAAFLDPDCIHESLFLNSKSLDKFTEIGQSSLRKVSILEARGELISSSLISKNEETKTWKLHRILQDTIIARLINDPAALISRFRTAVIAVLSAWPEARPDELHMIKTWDVCKQMYPHVLVLRDRFENLIEREGSKDMVEFSTLLKRAAGWQNGRGDWKALKKLAELALRVCYKCGGADCGDPDLLSDILFMLGARGTESNDKDSSLPFNKQFLELRLDIARVTGIKDDRLGKAYNQLGVSLMMYDNFDEATRHFQQALEIYRPMNNLQYLAMPTANLSLAYWLKGPDTYDLAITTLNRGLEERVQLHGPDDTESFRTGRLMHAMGNVKESQGHLEESETWHRKALQQYRSTIGNDHHRTADVCHRVAKHCIRKRDFKQASSLIDQALKIWTADKEMYLNEIARTTFLKARLLMAMHKKGEGQEAMDKSTSIYAKLSPNSSKTAQELQEDDFDRLVCFWSR